MEFTVDTYEARDGQAFHYPRVDSRQFITYGAALDFAVSREEKSISVVSGKKTRYCAVIRERQWR